MIDTEIYNWIREEILGRWPDTELTQAMKDDFYRGLYRVTAEVATKAAIECRADTQGKHPNAARICRMAQTAMKQANPVSDKKWQNVPLYRVYLGGAGDSYKTLAVGYRSTSNYRIPANTSIEGVQTELLDREWIAIRDHFGPDARFELYFDFNRAMKRSAEVWEN